MRDRTPLTVRAFAALARTLLPAGMRRGYGRQLTDTFEDLYDHALREGPPGAIPRLLARELYHLIRVSIKERTAEAATTRTNRHSEASVMHSVLQDIRYGIRSLVKRPGLTFIAATSLAIGIGANATIFAAIDVFLLRPLPFPEAERLVMVWTTNPERGWTEVSLSLPDALDFREASQTLDMAAYNEAELNLAGDGEPERLNGLRVTHNAFRVIGFAPALGRGFLPGEEAAGADRVAVLSRGLWERRYGRDPGIVGRSVQLNGIAHTVVGVMNEMVADPFANVEVWVPIGLTGEESRSARSTIGIARLRPGATLEAARTEVTQIAARLAAAYPEANADNSAQVIPLREQLFDENFRQASLIVSVAVAFLLLIACANVANLLLARATSREREIAVRAALGAGTGRIVRQLLTESLMLGLLGGLLGLAVAVAGIRGLISIIPPDLGLVADIGLDLRVLTFLIAVAMAAGLLVGVLPALRTARPDLRGSLHEGGGGRTAGRRGGRARSSLAVAQIALALALVISSTLLVRSYLNLRSVDLAYRASDVLTFRIALPSEKYPDDDAVRRFYSQLLERVAAIAGVESAGAAIDFPSDDGYGAATYYHAEGVEVEAGRWPVVSFRTVTPGFFDVMDLQIVEGRGFGEVDRAGAPPTVLVTRHLADQLWPGESPLGQRLVFSRETREVVGVVENHRTGGPDDDDGQLNRMVFFSFDQSPQRGMAVMIHTRVDQAGLLPLLRDAVRAIDPAQPIFAVRTLEESLAHDLSGNTVMAKLMGTMAVVALILALVGVYGVVAYTAAQRFHEVGLRMALGAEARDVRRLVVRQGLVLAVIGGAIGLGLSFATARALSAFLWGVGAFDPLTFAAVTLALLAAVVIASWVPARRATRVDPIIALRAD